VVVFSGLVTARARAFWIAWMRFRPICVTSIFRKRELQ